MSLCRSSRPFQGSHLPRARVSLNGSSSMRRAFVECDAPSHACRRSRKSLPAADPPSRRATENTSSYSASSIRSITTSVPCSSWQSSRARRWCLSRRVSASGRHRVLALAGRAPRFPEGRRGQRQQRHGDDPARRAARSLVHVREMASRHRRFSTRRCEASGGLGRSPSGKTN